MLGLHAYPEATPSGETPSGSDAILRNASVQQGCAPTLFEQWAHRFECRGQHMRLYTAHRHKAANTPLYDMERHTCTYTTPCSLMSGRGMPLYMQRQLCRYTCSGIRAAMHEAAIVPLYRHAAAIAATHKRSHSCKHSVFHQEKLLDSSALHGRRREAAPM